MSFYSPSPWGASHIPDDLPFDEFILAPWELQELLHPKDDSGIYPHHHHNHNHNQEIEPVMVAAYFPPQPVGYDFEFPQGTSCSSSSGDGTPYSIAPETTRSNSADPAPETQYIPSLELARFPSQTEYHGGATSSPETETTRSNSVESSLSGSSKSGELATAARRQRRRKQFSPEKKKETHMTRLSGACLRCWRIRKRCIKVDGACCKHCNTVLDQIPDSPCFRSRLSASALFREGPTEDFMWTRRRWLQTPFNDTKVWRSPQRRITVTQGMGLQLELLVKQYDPLPEDKDTYTWVDPRNNIAGSLTMPRFAVADIGGAQEAINRYVEDHMQSYIEKKVGSAELVPWTTFQMAVKLSRTEGSSLLRNTLRLWTASRIIEDPWDIVGNETLGVEPSDDPGSPYYGKVPVTPVMDFQIDNITIHKILLPLRKQVLQELQRKVQDNRRKDFLEIFLTMYILLYNIELTIAHDRWFAQRWNVGTRFSHYELIGNVFSGANIILTHFHYVIKGYAAFAVDWKKNTSEKQRGDQAKYLDTVSTASRHQASSLRVLREKSQYESPMFWCSQLFYDGWEPVASPCA